jgi:hypothetical protein
MLVVACQLHSTLNQYTKQYLVDLEDNYLTPQDWTELAEIRDFLEVFKEVILLTKGY